MGVDDEDRHLRLGRTSGKAAESHRAIKRLPVYGVQVDEAALKDLIRAAVALNLKGKSKLKPRRQPLMVQ